MKINRYYPKGYKGKTYSQEYIDYKESQGTDTSVFDTAKESIVLTRKEQEKLYEQSCDMILNNPRWVLDNLEFLFEYQVNWQKYGRK